MVLRDLMQREVAVIAPSATVQEAAALMKRLDIEVLPVCEDGRLVGLLTAHDLVARAAAEGRSPCTTTVGEVMCRDVVCCGEEDDVAAAVRLMQAHRIRQLAIVGGDRRFAGMLSYETLLTQAGGGDKASRALRWPL
jgi:CBS domain-containing protein